MTDTQLLNYIREEMKRQGVVWRKEQELFEMLIPNEDWQKYKTSWSNWKHMKVHDLKKSPHIRAAIQKTLFFDSTVWSASTLVQKEAVKEGVRRAFVEKEYSLPDWEKVIPSFSLNSEQKELLSTFDALSLTQIEESIKNNTQFFSRSFPNQNFLLELLDFLYEKGAYELIFSYVLPNLLSHHRGKLRVKVMEAHTLGSLKEPHFMESVKLLESIETSDEHKIIDLKTSMLSNLRRHYAKDTSLTYDELLHGMRRMVRMYHDLFLYAKRYHYYPAVNLVYVERVRSSLANEKSLVDLFDVYQKSKESILKEKESNNESAVYYASVTELEFLLLLGEKGVEQKMEFMLANLQPSTAWIDRTKRQMVEFIAMTERVGAKLPEIVTEFQKVITLLKDYENM